MVAISAVFGMKATIRSKNGMKATIRWSYGSSVRFGSCWCCRRSAVGAELGKIEVLQVVLVRESGQRQWTRRQILVNRRETGDRRRG